MTIMINCGHQHHQHQHLDVDLGQVSVAHLGESSQRQPLTHHQLQNLHQVGRHNNNDDHDDDDDEDMNDYPANDDDNDTIL